MSNPSSAVSSSPPHPPPPPATLQSLSSLCIDVISSKIDRFHPQEMGLLSEPEWEVVVKKRHRKTSPKYPGGSAAAVRGDGGLDGTGRSVPAIPDKVLSAIEGANPHLNRSAVVDRLVWKDCVEYKFKSGGPSRPRALQCPWPMLVDRVKKSGDDLLELLQPPTGEETMQQRTQTLNRSIQFLSESPMSVQLLTSSGAGKSVKKFIKACSKLCPSGATPTEYDIPDYLPDVWTPRLVPGSGTVAPTPSSPGQQPTLAHKRPRSEAESPLSRLERLLDGWKAVASSSGVVVASKVDHASQDFSGRGKKTTEKQHADDMSRLQTCQQWRDIFAALFERETKMVASHGARMKKLRENLEIDRPKMGKVNIRRQDAILSGSRGARAIASAKSAGGSSSGRPSKMQQLRRDVTSKTSRQMPLGNGAPRSKTAPPVRKAAKPAALSFGASVAFANSKSRASTVSGVKRKGIVGSVGRRDVVLSGGRKMALPKKSGGTGVFSSIAQKKQRAVEIAALKEKRRKENDTTPRFRR